MFELNKINLVNFILILISLVFSILFPFKLFLLSYAILGPLHYVTEINWLHEKKYFLNNKKSAQILILISFLISIPLILFTSKSLQEFLFANDFFHRLMYQIYGILPLILIFGFIFSIFMVSLKQKKSITKYIIISLILAFLIYQIQDLSLFLFIFLPTLIHVYLFTFLFMLYGALKDDSKLGIINAVLLLIIPIVIYFIPDNMLTDSLTPLVQDKIIDSNFHVITSKIGELTKHINISENINLTSSFAIKVQVFIAFSYTYHYLNWFSKTTKIGWYKSISKSKLVALISFWIIAIALYFYNYKLGFIALFIISFLHVILEFPLNVVSIQSIGKILKRKFSKQY